VLELADFQRIHLAPGEARGVRFTLGPEQLKMLDAQLRPIVEPGTFRVLVGRSASDIRLRGELIVR
jgi:beta-glucosidase